MEKPSVDTSKLLPSRKVIVRGIQAFIVFSAVGTMLGLWWKRPAGFEAVLAGMDWRFVGLLLPLIALDYWLGGMRYRLFLNGDHFPNVSLWDCMRSNWANMFMGAVTPSQSGGGPAQIYVLWRKGVRVADSLLLSTVNLSATMVFFLFSSVVALLWIPSGLFGEDLTTAFRLGFVAIGGMACFVLLVLFFPKGAHLVLAKLLSMLPLRSERANAIRTRILNKVDAEIQRFGDGFRSILKHNKTGLALTVVATMVLFSNKYIMGYVVARAIGQDVPFTMFIGLQVVQLLLVYFAPTPGASGVAELSSVWLMGKLMPESMLLVYVVLWRFLTTMLAAVIGGFVLLREVQAVEKPVVKEA